MGIPKVAYVIEHPKPRELSFDPIKDIQYLIDSFVAGNRVFRDDDVKMISTQISRIFDIYKHEINHEFTYHEACELQHFIRVLNYGVLFKFVVMIKLSDGTIHRIYYE